MDDDGRMELRDVEADETYEVVDYIDSDWRRSSGRSLLEKR